MAVFTTCRSRSTSHFPLLVFPLRRTSMGSQSQAKWAKNSPGQQSGHLCAVGYPGSPTFWQVMGASPSYSTMIGNVWTSTKSQDTSVLAFTGSLHETVSPKRSTAYGFPLFIVVVFPLIFVVAYDLHAGYVCQALAATNTGPTCSLWRAHHVRWQP